MEQNKFNPDNSNETDNRTGNYDKANDRMTFMTDLEKVQENLEKYGYNEQFRVEKGRLVGIESKKKYKPADVKAVNFYRFEGITDPDDMSILYAIETCDGCKGTLTDAYGLYSDDETGDFMKQVEVEKKPDGMGG
ncbi:MAG: hypothetical protein EOO14_24595 [Chitinophagaceae bacterium]|nr:MAG: hypothetical protein EOO14_24595 [Chitinophagaceae bacterium]